MFFWLKSKENLTLQINIWKREECLAFEIVVNFFWYYLNGSFLNVSCNVESETTSVNFLYWKFSGLFVLRMVLLPANDFFCVLSSFGKYWFPEVCRLPNVVISLCSIFKSHLLFFFVIYLVLTPFFNSILTFFFFWSCPVTCGILLVPQPGIKPNSDFLISRFMFLLFHSSSGIWNKRRELFKGVV